MSCTNVITLPQYTGTCWFNALVMALFFSEHMRKVLLSKKDEWDHVSLKLRKVFNDILQRRSKVYAMKAYAFLFFKLITPELLLKHLHKENPEKFNFNPNASEGYFNTLYLPNLLEYMGVKALHLDAFTASKGDNPRDVILYYSNIYNNYKFEHVKQNDGMVYRKVFSNSVFDTSKILPKYDVITVRFSKEKHQEFNKFMKVSYKNITSNKVIIKENEYLNDSVLLTNFNTSSCQKGHDMCGLTCNGERFIYNGWMRTTIDASKGSSADKRVVNQTYPCELMKYDWLNNYEDFCISSSYCKLRKVNDEALKKRVCFNFHKGERTLILVHSDFAKMLSPLTSPVVPSPKPKPAAKPTAKPKPATAKPAAKPAAKPKSASGDKCASKKCDKGKVCNPLTGRCVKSTGAIGKKISKRN